MRAARRIGLGAPCRRRRCCKSLVTALRRFQHSAQLTKHVVKAQGAQRSDLQWGQPFWRWPERKAGPMQAAAVAAGAWCCGQASLCCRFKCQFAQRCKHLVCNARQTRPATRRHNGYRRAGQPAARPLAILPVAFTPTPRPSSSPMAMRTAGALCAMQTFFLAASSSSTSGTWLTSLRAGGGRQEGGCRAPAARRRRETRAAWRHGGETAAGEQQPTEACCLWCRQQVRGRCAAAAAPANGTHLGLSAAGLGLSGASAACARTAAARRAAPSRRAGLISAWVARGRLQRTAVAGAAAAQLRRVLCILGRRPEAVDEMRMR